MAIITCISVNGANIITTVLLELRYRKFSIGESNKLKTYGELPIAPAAW